MKPVLSVISVTQYDKLLSLRCIYSYTECPPLGLTMNYGCADTYISKVGLQTRNLVGSTKTNSLNCIRAICHISVGPKAKVSETGSVLIIMVNAVSNH